MLDHSIYKNLESYRFILGSSSPRRLQILSTNLNLKNVDVIPSNYAEDLSKEGITNEEYVRQTCLNKGKALLEEISFEQPTLILTSDTIISCANRVFEKPKTKSNQLKMFDFYKHNPEVKVITAVTIFKVLNDTVTEFSDLSITTLHFSGTEELIRAYVNSEEGLNVAGGFKYQERGCLLFSGIVGDYFNIIGLPVSKTLGLLEKALH